MTISGVGTFTSFTGSGTFTLGALKVEIKARASTGEDLILHGSASGSGNSYTVTFNAPQSKIVTSSGTFFLQLSGSMTFT